MAAQTFVKEASSLVEVEMDWDQIQRNWRQTKRTIKQKWIRLTDEDLDAIDGQRDRLEDSIYKRFGFAADHIRKEVDDWLRWQR